MGFPSPLVTPDTWWHGSSFGGGTGYDYIWLCAYYDASEFKKVWPSAYGAWMWATLGPIEVGNVGLIVRLLSALNDTPLWTWRADDTFRFDIYS